eukprot:6162542-Amphidinium_carterae.1
MQGYRPRSYGFHVDGGWDLHASPATTAFPTATCVRSCTKNARAKKTFPRPCQGLTPCGPSIQRGLSMGHM